MAKGRRRAVFVGGAIGIVAAACVCQATGSSRSASRLLIGAAVTAQASAAGLSSQVKLRRSERSRGFDGSDVGLASAALLPFNGSPTRLFSPSQRATTASSYVVALAPKRGPPRT